MLGLPGEVVKDFVEGIRNPLSEASRGLDSEKVQKGVITSNWTSIMKC